MTIVRSVSLAPTCELEFEGRVFPSAIVLGDIDGDGVAELVVGSAQGELAVFKGLETSVAWRKCHGLGTITCITVGESFGGCSRCLVVATAEGRCLVFDLAAVASAVSAAAAVAIYASAAAASYADVCESHRGGGGAAISDDENPAAVVAPSIVVAPSSIISTPNEAHEQGSNDDNNRERRSSREWDPESAAALAQEIPTTLQREEQAADSGSDSDDNDEELSAMLLVPSVEAPIPYNARSIVLYPRSGDGGGVMLLVAALQFVCMYKIVDGAATTSAAAAAAAAAAADGADGAHLESNLESSPPVREVELVARWKFNQHVQSLSLVTPATDPNVVPAPPPAPPPRLKLLLLTANT
jgi:hypothetical protein